MPKQTRKRRFDTSSDNVEQDVIVPKAKLRLSSDEAQAEEEQLNKILFGGTSSFLKSLEEAENEAGHSTASIASDSGVGETDSEGAEMMQEDRPAWHDEDDDGIEVGQAVDAQGRKLPNAGVTSHGNKYSDLLQYKFKSVVGQPSWANMHKVQSTDSDSDDEQLLQRCGFIRSSDSQKLGKGTLDFKKVRDLNSETYSEGAYINAVEFHPSSSVGLVAGHSGVASLYAVDGKRNTKLHSVAFQHFPIFCAKFLSSGNEAVFGSRHSHIFSYDLMTAKTQRVSLPSGVTQAKKFAVSPDYQFIAVAGKWGDIHLLTSRSKEKIATLKQDADVTALTFSPNSNYLFGHSNCGEITIFDVNTRRAMHKLVDDGCLQGSALAISPSNQFMAAGSAQGIVNIYSMDDVFKNRFAQPKKIVANLTTAIHDLKFNSTSEILALSSVDIQNSVKLLHLASGSVFSNFPSFGTRLGHVNVLNISPGSGYLALGNNQSVVSLYRLKHFKHY